MSIKSKCPSCKQDTDWHSQPYMPASQIRAGNFLLALSIPLSGGSPGKVIKLCNHMGLKCFNQKSYYIYQKVCKVQYNDQPRTQALLPTPGAAAKTLASFGHVSLIKFSSRGGDGSPKVDLFAGYC